MFADGHGSEQTFTADTPRRGAPFPERVPGTTLEITGLHSCQEEERPGITKETFVCLFVCFEHHINMN